MTGQNAKLIDQTVERVRRFLEECFERVRGGDDYGTIELSVHAPLSSEATPRVCFERYLRLKERYADKKPAPAVARPQAGTTDETSKD